MKEKNVFNWMACLVLIPAFSVLTAGCMVKTEPDDPRYAPMMPDIPQPLPPVMGSLYNPKQSLGLYDDTKAHQIGDIITITLVEKTQAKKDMGTRLKKQSKIALAEKNTVLNNRKNLNIENMLEGNRHFQGEADASQSNELKGGITVTVAEVLPNKNLVIRGEKWITLNQGSEFIRITGIVRSEDIAPDNTVQSTRVANSRITYSGSGALAETNTLGWLTRFFHSGGMPI
ncbi:MAG: flagellar basal body L-ring protein FlgH [Pseudomonadota bacterium]|jgi:flagellar L-ring protein precursor FlgH